MNRSVVTVRQREMLSMIPMESTPTGKLCRYELNRMGTADFRRRIEAESKLIVSIMNELGL